ncbi:HTH-type transcriptional activator mta [bioreactor metagenome]|uniref:HTH-type transcriptional activator mta n=1 Tax=bioreactor metagenome TaxID=1076179 RepID=A0A645BXT3_9ZZZZ
MEYTVTKLARLSGVSARTLRYYDAVGLLRPGRVTESGYRIYGKEQVDKLQQVLFYRELGMPLSDIAKLLETPGFDKSAALKTHLAAMMEERERLTVLITTLEKTITHEEAGTLMNDKEKFEGFKREAVVKNEEKYGTEIREKYGDEAVDASNAKLMGLTKAEYDAMQQEGEALLALLDTAVAEGADPTGPKGKTACEMHKKWLMYTWPTYSPKAHKGLGTMYTADERFTAYYDKGRPGCAAFLKAAIDAFAK